MPVIAIINRKGGSGKSTTATHVAAWLATQGFHVMLGDIDRQQSTRAWLSRRDPTLPAIQPWAVDHNRMLRAPSGVTHVVLDTPGSLYGFELAKVVMACDVILMPVCNSIFDRDSALACYAELQTLPRVAAGKCSVAAVGMRVDARTSGAAKLAEWAAAANIPLLGSLRETQLYVRGLELGMSIFDLPVGLTEKDRLQWEPILNWLSARVSVKPTLPIPDALAEPVKPTVVPSVLSRFLQEQRAARSSERELQCLS